jgi:hypothetical protein
MLSMPGFLFLYHCSLSVVCKTGFDYFTRSKNILSVDARAHLGGRA